MRLLLVLAFVWTAGCGTSDPRPVQRQQSTGSGAGVPAINPAPDDSDDWLRPANNYASTRFSRLGQITRNTVQQLAVTATFSTGYTRGHEAAPLVVNGTMYIVSPFPNVLYALD